MKRKILSVTIFFFLAVAMLHARPIEIKLGSVVPDNSVYSELLNKLAAEWEEISDGRVKVKLYFSGFKDDSDIIRKIRINQLQAGVITGFGMQVLYPNMLALSIPSLIQSDEELSYVLDQIEPQVQDELSKKRFKLLAWSNGGWIYFFSRNKVIEPEDLRSRSQKLASSGSGGSSEMHNVFNHIGFHPVHTPSNEVLPALVSGKADAVYATSIAVAARQWFGVTKHMTDMPIAPFFGAFIISERVWDRIPSDIQPEMRSSVRRIAGELERELADLEEEAITIMKDHGLKIHDVPPSAKRKWDRTFDKAVDYASGNIFEQEFVETIKDHIEEYRSTH